MRSSLILSLAFSSASFFADAQVGPELLSFDPIVSSDVFPEQEASTTSTDIVSIENTLPEIESNIIEYAVDIATDPEFFSAAIALATAIPINVQDQIASDPSGFILSLITATSNPPWATAIPTDVQSYFLSVGNHFSSIVDEELEGPQPTTLRGSFVFPTDGFVIPTGVPQGTAGFTRPTGTGAYPTGTGTGIYPSGTGILPSGTGGIIPSTGFITGTNTGLVPSPTGGNTGPTPRTSPPILFEGAASPLQQSRSIAVAAALFIGGAASWLLA